MISAISELLENLSLAYSNLGEGQLAEKSIHQAYELRRRASDREKLLIEAQYFFSLGDLQKARDTFELFNQTYPRDSGAHNLRGCVWDTLGQYDKAINEFRAAINLDPADGADYSNLVSAYICLNRFDEAKQRRKRQPPRAWTRPSWATHSILLPF